MAKAETPVEAMTPVKYIDDEKPRFLDRHLDDLFYKRKAEGSPVEPATPSTAGATMETSSAKFEGINLSSARGLVPIKPAVSLLTAHLIFGGARGTPYNATIRTSVVCTALLGEIAFFGAGLILFEGSDVFSSYNPSDPQPDYDSSRDSILAGASVMIQLCISVMMVWLYSRQPKAAVGTNTFLVFSYLAIIIGLSVVYTKYWSMIWLVGFGIAAMIEILLAQTVIMVFIYNICR